MSEALIQTRGPGVLRKSAKVAPSNKFSLSQREKILTSLTPPPSAFTRLSGSTLVLRPASALRIRNFSRKAGERRRLFKAVIGRRDRAAGHAGHKADAVEQRM